MTYIVAEIGQNHNGQVKTALQMIDVMAGEVTDHFNKKKLPGIDAIKLCKRSLDHELTPQKYNEPYRGRNSFGPTYGKHRQALELTAEDHFTIYKHAKSKGLDVIETICHIKALDDITRYFEPDFIKIASRDLTNHRLLRDLHLRRPYRLIYSSGMADQDDMDAAIQIYKPHTLLHCISQYPADYPNLNLNRITTLRGKYQGVINIGYSDHSIGIMASVAAVALGATMIEKHVTLSRKAKGSDHAAALEPDGLRRVVRDIRNLEMAIGSFTIYKHPASRDAAQKLERSICANKPLGIGHVITSADLEYRSPGTGFPPKFTREIIGRKVVKPILTGEMLTDHNTRG